MLPIRDYNLYKLIIILMKKLLYLILIPLILSFSFAIEVYMPDGASIDGESWVSFETDSSSSWWLDLFNVVNKYLWYILWLILIWVLVYAGSLLITSEWDPAVLKKINKLVIYAFVWLAITISAYFFIKLLVNIF